MKFSIILFFCIIGILNLFYYDVLIAPQQEQFIELASSFLQGKLYFSSATFDTALHNGHYYWPLGPFPAILLMPFVYLFGNAMRQGYLLFILSLFNLFLLFRIAKYFFNNFTNSLIISFAILFSTVYLGIALTPSSWSLGQILGFTLILLTLEAYFFKRSWLLIGIYLALAFATRVSLISTSVFFILILLSSKLSREIKFKNFILLISPIILSIVIIGWYNYARFGNVFETGYSLQPLVWGWSKEDFQLWSIKNFPTHLYTLFLKMPDAIYVPESKTNIMRFPYIRVDGSGLSIFFTSTIFVWILFSRWKIPIVKFAAITCLVAIFAISGSFTTGGWHYGYRYAIDFYPMLFIILLHSFKKNVSYKFLVVALVGFLINLYFINMMYYHK